MLPKMVNIYAPGVTLKLVFVNVSDNRNNKVLVASGGSNQILFSAIYL